MKEGFIVKFNYDIYYGTFLRRPNRFIAYVDLDGEEVLCHIPNTGRLGELLVPGAQVILSHHPSPARKTEYELRMVMKNFCWISIDSQLPNALAEEAIASDVIEELQGYSEIRREVTYQNSRFDLQLLGNDTCFVEVKGVTLERDGWCYFPDAPTARGKKHIDELICAMKDGYRSVLLFVVQITDVRGFSPNKITDPDFSDKVKYASENGVEILAYNCLISPQEISITGKVPIILT
ncbi:MAG TPA: DNA/RNA nuclease SfsA [Lachnospiraceae bacterium]|jgi:sugar fermentation stimulation protein A|nr:DNA/RNA nuclease SfsA [Lachnospiraceae bacterium]HBY70707.1 DNA/RNA nuclease SfsA [Lachnospiraceae bacterium]HCA70129.1 DNA/RNA nuclease SfsA [Lachnospiraceae bacterium]HCR39741.1 DNA/RNA nuclease SfsA [Lachnospiraceae bacterium]